MPKPTRRGQEVNRGALALILGCSAPTVDAMVNRGLPFVEKGGKGSEWKFNTADVIEWLKDEAVAKVAASLPEGERITEDEAKRRRAIAQAVIAEIEADEALRRVVAVDDVALAVAKEYGAVRQNLSQMASKVAGRAATMASATEIQALIEESILDALEPLQHDRPVAGA